METTLADASKAILEALLHDKDFAIKYETIKEKLAREESEKRARKRAKRTPPLKASELFGMKEVFFDHVEKNP